VEKDERGPILCGSSLFEVGETKAVHTYLAALDHGEWKYRFGLKQALVVLVYPVPKL
jgi:hypothetical protein